MSNTQTESADRSNPSGSKVYRWYIAFMLFIAYLCQFTDFQIWSPMIPKSKELFGFSMTQVAGFISALAFGKTFSQLPGGYIADKYGPKPVLITSMILMGIGTFAMAFFTTYVSGLVIRFLTGVSGGAIYACCIKLIFSWFPKNERATAVGIVAMATSGAITASNIIVPFFLEFYNWRYIFYSMGIVTIVLGILYHFTIKDVPQALESTSKKGNPFSIGGIKSLLSNKGLIYAILCGFAAIWATWGTANWALAYLTKSVKISTVAAAGMMSAFGIAGILSKPLSGFISDKLGGRRKPVIIIDLALFAVMLLILPFIRDPQVLWIFIPVLGFVAFGYSAAMNTLIPEQVDSYFVATATGLYIFISQFANMLQPIVIGRILDVVSPQNSYIAAFAVLAAGAVLGIAFVRGAKENCN